MLVNSHVDTLTTTTDWLPAALTVVRYFCPFKENDCLHIETCTFIKAGWQDELFHWHHAGQGPKQIFSGDNTSTCVRSMLCNRKSTQVLEVYLRPKIAVSIFHRIVFQTDCNQAWLTGRQTSMSCGGFRGDGDVGWMLSVKTDWVNSCQKVARLTHQMTDVLAD